MPGHPYQAESALGTGRYLKSSTKCPGKVLCGVRRWDVCHTFPFPALLLGSEMQIPSLGDVQAVAPQEGRRVLYNQRERKAQQKITALNQTSVMLSPEQFPVTPKDAMFLGRSQPRINVAL